MRNIRIRAATKVAQSLLPAEADIDTAMASLAALTTAMLSARVEANLPPGIGKEAFDLLGDATSLLFKARSKVIEAHFSLHGAQRDIGLREMSFGPTQPFIGDNPQPLPASNLVAIAA